MEAKIILICGAGKGKSHMGQLLEDSYKTKKIPCSRYCTEEPEEIIEKISKQNGGFAIIETNSQPQSLAVKPWQKIIID